MLKAFGYEWGRASAHHRMRSRGIWAAAVGLLIFVCSALTAGDAFAQRAFTTRAQFNDRGDVLLIGNKLLTCESTGTTGTCPGGVPNAGEQNGNRNMVVVNVDPSAGLANSSSADLILPAGSTVLHASLYWGARADPANAARGTIRLRAPGSATYATITSTDLDTITTQGDATTRPYLAVADVTSIVQAAGSGTYFAGGVLAATGNGGGLGHYAGWSLVVIYRDTTQPFRRLQLFDGAQVVVSGSPVDITVTGILTPATGAFSTRVGAVVWEGDDGITGDNLQIARLPAGPFTTITNAVNPAGNFFNSSISRLGVHFAAKNPNHVNQLALDVDYVDASGVLLNSDTQATLRYTSTGDVYFPHALAFVVDLFVPDLASSIAKSASNITSGGSGSSARPGDILEYTISFQNTGGDGATNVVTTDPIPVGTTYVPGSIFMLTNATGAFTGPITDASGDDVGEFDAVNNRVRVRSGQGATATAGGLVPPGQSSSFRFRVQVNANVAHNTVITNTASVVNNSQTLGDSIVQTGSASASTTVLNEANLSITKTDGLTTVPSGGAVVYTIVVSNAGPSAANGAVFTDPAVANLTVTGVTCGSPTGGAVCPASPTVAAMQGSGIVIPTLPSGGSVTFTVTGTAGTSGTITNVANIAPPAGVTDPTPGNNSATDTTTITPPADMSASFGPLPTVVSPGQSFTGLTLSCTNVGGSPATNATCVPTVSAGSISSLSCTPATPVASLSAGAVITCTFTYTAPGVAGGADEPTTSVTFTGSTGAANDSNPANNVTTATADVIDAVDDAGTVGSTLGGTVSILGNDSLGSTVNPPVGSGGLSSVAIVPGANTTLPGASLNASHQIVVPPGTPAGVYTVEYEICVNPCDRAIATITVADTTADLTIQKNGPASVGIGGTVIYTITISNNGVAAADGATFSDTLPAGLSGVTASCTSTAGAGTTPCGGIPLTLSGTNLSGSIPAFPSGGKVVITIQGTATGSSGSFVNTATVTPPPSVTDPNPGNNTSTVSTIIATPIDRADLSVTKVGTSAALPGGAVSYVIDVVNAGPGPANGAVFSDTVPGAITAVTWSCSASGGAICPAASGSGNTINQTIAVMPMNGALRYTVSGTLSAMALPGATVTNTATVTPPPGVTDPEPGNNTGSSTTTVSVAPPPSANLAVSKVGPSTVAAGAVVTYTIVAVNNGPAAANGTVITDTVPSALTGVSWTCSGSGGAVCGVTAGSGNAISVTLTSFPSGAQATVRITATAPSSGSFQNTAVITPPPTVSDPDPTDNVGGPVITSVPPTPADLVTTVTLSGVGFLPGDPVTATVTLSNIGGSPAANAVVTLQLPPGVTVQTISNGGTYNPVTGVVTWPVIPIVPPFTSPASVYTVVFSAPVGGGTVLSTVSTADPEVTAMNNPSSAVFVTNTPIVPIPMTPPWLIALALLALAVRRLRGRG